ncbi:unnamed protein product, partial [Arabidopsis halleri]
GEESPGYHGKSGAGDIEQIWQIWLSLPQVKEGNHNFSAERNKALGRNNSKAKKGGGAKQEELSGPRQKNINVQKPTQGLVFGPTKGEEVLIANGKRLRGETDCQGRPGGVFVSDQVVQPMESGLILNPRDTEASRQNPEHTMEMNGITLQKSVTNGGSLAMA